MDTDESYDYLFKIVLIGEAGVGKTCIVQRFKNGTFLEKNSSTIGVDFSMKTLTLDNKRVKVSHCPSQVFTIYYNEELYKGFLAIFDIE